MEVINAIVLGVVEGLTEFLPVSSTGHLILAEQFFRLQNQKFAESFMVIIQSGAILAVIIHFWKRFWPFTPKDQVERQKSIRSLWLRTIIGTLPFVAIAFLAKDFVKEHLFNPLTVAIALVVWGVVIIVLERHLRRRQTTGQETAVVNRPEDLSIRQTLLIGLFQCLAIVPGTSRSAATIVGSMLLGTSRVAAAEFSFFLAIPALLGAAAYEFLSTGLKFTSQEWLLLGTGLVVSFAVAYGVVAIFMNFIRRSSFQAFGWYRIALGSLILALYLAFPAIFHSA